MPGQEELPGLCNSAQTPSKRSLSHALFQPGQGLLEHTGLSRRQFLVAKSYAVVGCGNNGRFGSANLSSKLQRCQMSLARETALRQQNEQPLVKIDPRTLALPNTHPNCQTLAPTQTTNTSSQKYRDKDRCESEDGGHNKRNCRRENTVHVFPARGCATPEVN